MRPLKGDAHCYMEDAAHATEPRFRGAVTASDYNSQGGHSAHGASTAGMLPSSLSCLRSISPGTESRRLHGVGLRAGLFETSSASLELRRDALIRDAKGVGRIGNVLGLYLPGDRQAQAEKHDAGSPPNPPRLIENPHHCLIAMGPAGLEPATLRL